MSAALLSAVLGFVRESLPKDVVTDVREYAGEFGAADIGKLSFACPAVLVSVLGWRPVKSGDGVRLMRRGTSVCSMAAFVVTKHPKATARMHSAMAIAKALDQCLEFWAPTSTETAEIAGVEPDRRAENLHNAALEKTGLALWLVTWKQCVCDKTPPGQLYDLVGVDIVSTAEVNGIAPGGDPVDAPIDVTHDIEFESQSRIGIN